MIEKLTHFDEGGQATMVDVTDKAPTRRTAIAKGRIRLSPDAMRAVLEGTAGKGDVLGVARIAGIMGAKRTGELIPLCHPLGLDKCAIDFHTDEEACEIEATCTASLTGKTGGGDGGAYRGERGASDHLRHVQGHRQAHGDHRHSSGEENRREERRVYQ